jgi:hypothetical protein
MLDDAILLNINSLRDNDRLTLVTVQQLTSYLKARPAPSLIEPKVTANRVNDREDNSTQEEDQKSEDLDLVVDVEGVNDDNPE